MTTLVPVLGDQLPFDRSSFDGADPADCVILMMDVGDNRQMAMPCRTWDRVNADTQANLRKSAQAHLDGLDAVPSQY